ncbi:MAG: hypothetical protein IPM38_15585 [Ignavibacteria bacterium]|nr:hypothetical protein [Ignavibacteria bacterium]
MKIIYLLILAIFGAQFYSCGPEINDIEECEYYTENNGIHNFKNPVDDSLYTYVFGENGGVYQVEDLCIIQTINTNTLENLTAMDGNEFGAVIVGMNGTILKGNLFPLSLTLKTSGTNKNLNNVTLGVTSGSFIVVGDSGTILKSTNFGDNWYSVSSGTVEDLYEITKITYRVPEMLIASGYNGEILESTNNGESWYSSFTFEDGNLSGLPVVIRTLQYVDSTTGWAAGNNGKIYRTTSAGDGWNSQSSGISDHINKIQFSSFNYGYACADNGRVIYTTNGGSNWQPHPIFDTLTNKNLNSFIQSDSVSFTLVGDSTLINIKTNISVKPLSGIVPVGSGENITTVSNALTVADYLGIKDSVTFMIKPGTYNEELEIKKVYPLTAKLKIDGGNAAELAKDMSDTSNFTMKISGAKNVVIENLTISNLDTNKGRVILIEGDVSNVKFNNVTFNGPFNFTTNVNKSLVMSDGLSSTKLTNVEFNNCTFNKGTHALRLHSSSSGNYFSGLKVNNCVFKNSGQAAIALNFNENFEITSNTFDSTYGGMNFLTSRNFNVNKNKIHSTYIALQLQGCTSVNPLRNLISNNFVNSHYLGLYMVLSNSNHDFYHNSFNIQNPYDTSYIPFTSNVNTFFASGTGNKMRNNIFINRRRGQAFSMSAAATFSSFNYNDYYTNGDTLALWVSTYHPNITSLKAASGRDTNSVSQNVSFISPTDLHLTGSSNGDTLLKSLPLSLVPNDIDGASRNQTATYMGADEGSISFFPKMLKLKTKFEAYAAEDTLTVQMRNSSSPYALIESVKGVGGQGNFKTFNFNAVSNGIPYYINVTHRNSIETWSAAAQTFTGDSLNYDFTTAATQAFGSNMILKSGMWTFYSGDVNQDGTIDITDGSLIDNDLLIFASGYLPTDLNGDGITDLSDAVFADNNSFNFIGKITPLIVNS